ncbi:MAG: thiolase family protein [Geodermatophilaceae bacterium]|nr:thiolase family protein [Geodermatophilaceae bacterium]
MDELSPVIVAARRTPFGRSGGALREVPLEGLTAPVLRALLVDTGADLCDVDEVILGNVMGPGGNPARVAALAAGLGESVTGLTVDRQCGSGLEAITLAATAIRAGRADLVLAGGAESASMAPLRATRTEPLRFYDRAPFAPVGFDDPDMGAAADHVAAIAGVTRERQDAYAAASHARAIAAQDAGRFAAELVPLDRLARDERPRRGFTMTRLSRFPAAFTTGGTATAANSCGVNDGAALVAVVPERLRRGRPGLRIVDWVCAGVHSGEPGLGPVPAVRRLLDRTGVAVGDIGVVEFTEAFAGQVLACLDALGIDEARVCPDGGAIALGHPWGASGAALAVRLYSQQVRADGPRLGLATCGIGGGMGIAVLLERVG